MLFELSTWYTAKSWRCRVQTSDGRSHDRNWNRFIDVEALPPSSCHDFRTLIEHYLKKADSIRKQSYQSSQKREPYHPESQATWSWKRRGWKNCNPVHDPQLYPAKCLDFWMDLKMLQAKQRPFKHHFRAWGNAGDSRKVRLTSTTKKAPQTTGQDTARPWATTRQSVSNPAPDSQSLLSKNGWRSVPWCLGHKTEILLRHKVL